MEKKTGNILKRCVCCMLAAAVLFVVFSILQVAAMQTEYAFSVSFDAAASFFVSANGIFAVVMIVFAVFMLAWRSRSRVDVVKGFLWAMLAALLYYVMPLYSYSIADSGVVSTVLLMMLFVPQTVAAVMMGSVLYDFGNKLGTAHRISFISVFVSLFFLIFHVVNCFFANVFSAGGNYVVFAQLTTVAINAAVLCLSVLLCIATKTKASFGLFTGEKAVSCEGSGPLAEDENSSEDDGTDAQDAGAADEE